VPGSFFGRSTFGQPPQGSFALGFVRRPPLAAPFFPRRRIFFPTAVLLPVPIYAGPYPEVAQSVPQVAAVSAPSEVESQIESLREEVHALREERLRDEIDRLKEEREFRRESRATYPGEETPPSRSGRQPSLQSGREEAPETVLVFRDGHRLSVRNYAVVGQTFWDFTEGRARKILLSALDLEATARVNEERGVEFRLPTRETLE
jgi:hypothetical protein